MVEIHFARLVKFVAPMITKRLLEAEKSKELLSKNTLRAIRINSAAKDTEAVRKGKTTEKTYYTKYNNSERGKVVQARHRNTPKRKQYEKEWRASAAGRASHSKFYKSPKGKMLTAKKNSRRQRDLLTLKILGTPKNGLVLHHMTADIAVYVPKAINKIPHALRGKRAGYNMDKVNALAMEWYERGSGSILSLN